jgi:hypothetical protein
MVAPDAVPMIGGESLMRRGLVRRSTSNSAKNFRP